LILLEYARRAAFDIGYAVTHRQTPSFGNGATTTSIRDPEASVPHTGIEAHVDC